MYKKKMIGFITFVITVALLCHGLLKVPVYAEEEILYVYDDAGRVVSATYPNGTVVIYHYDSNGNLIETEKVAGSRYKSEESREVSTEDDALVDVESPASQSPTSVDVTGNDLVKKQTSSVSEDTTESETDRQKKDEDIDADDATTEEKEDTDEDDHKGIGKWIALAAIGGTAVAAVGVVVVAAIKLHK